jgi:hypothetical protein
MKKALLPLLAALPLAACVAGYDGPYGPGPVAYDGYYDDYYGPIYDGYWGNGGVFYYRSHEHGRLIADRGNHFRHDMGGAGPGGRGGPGGGGHFHPMHGNFNPPAGRGHR